MRSWPGGLCVSRSIGDVDCGPFITPLPHVKQMKIPPSGGRIIMASDGLWDAVTSEKAAKCSRGLPATAAAPALVKESLRLRGLRDDITVMVVDLLPADTLVDDKKASAVPKSPAGKSIFSKFKMQSSSKKITGSRSMGSGTLVRPHILEDHDSLRGGDLYDRYMKSNLSIHAGGAFCTECGVQVQDSALMEASTRAGNLYCTKHTGKS